MNWSKRLLGEWMHFMIDTQYRILYAFQKIFKTVVAESFKEARSIRTLLFRLW
jgi:hypothetical protein